MGWAGEELASPCTDPQQTAGVEVFRIGEGVPEVALVEPCPDLGSESLVRRGQTVSILSGTTNGNDDRRLRDCELVHRFLQRRWTR